MKYCEFIEEIMQREFTYKKIEKEAEAHA